MEASTNLLLLLASVVSHVAVAEAEIVSELMNDGLANLVDRLVATAGDAQDGTAEDGDRIGEHQGVVSAGRERHPVIQPEELGVAAAEHSAIGARGFFLHHDGDVLQEIGEPFRQLAERVLDELLEFLRRDGGAHQPGVMLNPNTQPLPGRWKGFA